MANGRCYKHLMPQESISWDAEQIADWEIQEALRFAPGTHPIDQVDLYVPHSLYEWQHDSLAAACRVHSRAVLSTANESGKTSMLIPSFGLGMMCAFPGCNVYSTSGSGRQLVEQLAEQQLDYIINQKSFKENGWKIRIGKDNFKVTAPNGSIWYGYVCSDAMTAEGFHGDWKVDEDSGEKTYRPCIYIVDEAKSVGDGVHEAIRRIDPDFWLSVSTPGKEAGWFYEAMDPDTMRFGLDTNDTSKKTFNIYAHPYDVNPAYDYQKEYEDLDATNIFNYRRMVSWEQCPHLHTRQKKLERQKIIKKYGKNSAFAKSMLYGQFQRSDDYQPVYTEADIELMKRAMRGEFKPIGKDVEAAGDISGGGDEQGLMLRIGTCIELQDHHQQEPDPGALMAAPELDQADYWVKLLRDELDIQPWHFIVDGGGLGATVANYMEARCGYIGIKRAQANTGPRFKFEYRDKYTETHFLLKELLSAEVLVLKYDKILLKQMRSRRCEEMTDGFKIKMEPKPKHRKREKSSPDRLDTLVYLFYDFDWSLLFTYMEHKQNRVDPNAMTPMEKKAQSVTPAGKAAFSNLPSAQKIRDRVRMDSRLRNLKIGR